MVESYQDVITQVLEIKGLSILSSPPRFFACLHDLCGSEWHQRTMVMSRNVDERILCIAANCAEDEYGNAAAATGKIAFILTSEAALENQVANEIARDLVGAVWNFSIGSKADLVKASLNDYSWGELKAIAQRISMASDANQALCTARKYNLVSQTGELRLCKSKDVILSAGLTNIYGQQHEASVRIIGIWADRMPNGKKAGITFSFNQIIAFGSMNNEETGEPWVRSDMRNFLNESFLGSLPYEIRKGITPVEKSTFEYDTRHTLRGEKTVDNVWLLSENELTGSIDKTGQYQFYAEKKVNSLQSSSIRKWPIGKGSKQHWWLRSPSRWGNEFLSVDGKGYERETYYGGISPCFCY